MPDLADLYPGFASHWIDTSVGRIFARSGGEGPPLLLLHGYPQTNLLCSITHIAWLLFCTLWIVRNRSEKTRPHITTSSRGGKSREKNLNIGCQDEEER